VKPDSVGSDEELSRLLEQLLAHLRKADKGDGRLQPGSIPNELVRKIVEQVIDVAPAGHARARISMDGGDRSFSILIEKNHDDCTQPMVVKLQVTDQGDDYPNYLLTIRCGDTKGSHSGNPTS
jgi:hypothetical protein